MNNITSVSPESVEVLNRPVAAPTPGDLIQRRSLDASPIRTFANPIIPPASADPWVIAWKGAYYYCESRDQKTIWIRKADCFTQFAEEDVQEARVFTAPVLGPNSNAVWAPELHRINDRWYIYYAADDGLNENHRMWVLESVTDDPMGAYRCKGCLETGGWAIDLTVVHNNIGELFGIWSGWPGAVNGRQNLYIARMENPWTIAGDRALLAEPEHAWEKVEMDICEGPQILQRHGKLLVVYSASGSWTEDYCLGMIEFTGGDILNSKNWKKWEEPVFQKNAKVWGIGHCSFVQSPDGMEDWVIFHAKSRKKAGWNDRNVHAQRFTWTEAGYPYFGQPIASGISLPAPTGEFAPVAAI